MIDISMLNSGALDTIEINETLEFTEENLKNTEIKRLENIKATGQVTRIENDIYHLTLNITGNMILLCARSLEEVAYPLNIFIDKNLSNNEFDEEKQVIFQNSLDIFSIVWENIVLEVPLRVIKEEASFLKEGNGWSLIDEEEQKRNSPFSELKSMLDMEGKE